MPTFSGVAIRGSDATAIDFPNACRAVEVTSFGAELTVTRNANIVGYVPALASKVFKAHWGDNDTMTVAGGEYSVENVNP